MTLQLADYYLPGDCPNCARRRLEFVLDVSDDCAEDPDEKLVAIRCEKCHMTWRIGEETGEYVLNRSFLLGKEDDDGLTMWT